MLIRIKRSITMQSISNELGKIIGVRIADLRKDRNLTQAELAKRLHKSKSTIAHYEQGITVPPLEVIASLSVYFNISSDYLLGQCDQPISLSMFYEEYFGDVTVGKVINKIALLPKEKQEFMGKLLETITGKK